jgi:wyosine [tRNA(Phe)-imidazoG37] synthetase (radical SAM superfamily)
MTSFREEYEGQIWLEVFLLKGITAGRAEVGKMACLAKRLKPDRIQLNTVTRPPAEKHALAVDPITLQSLAPLFGDRAEAISDAPTPEHQAAAAADEGAIMQLLRRRPCTIQGLSHGLGVPAPEVAKRLEILERDGAVVIRRRGSGLFYVPSRSSGHSRHHS